MELQLQNEYQYMIADLLWKATTQEQVDSILKIFEKDAHIVYNMMLAEYFDTVDDVDAAQKLLKRISKIKE